MFLASRIAAATRSTGTVVYGVRLSSELSRARLGWFEFTSTGSWRWLGRSAREILPDPLFAVEAGVPGTREWDHGTITGFKPGGLAEVAWVGAACQTSVPISSLRSYGGVEHWFAPPKEVQI